MHNTARVKQDAHVAKMTFAAQLTEYQANIDRYRALKHWEDDTQPALSLTDEQIEAIIDSTEKDTARVASMILQ